jgi:ABC-type amino acid transport system permease subunit
VKIYNIHGAVVQEMPAQYVSKGRHSLAIQSFDIAHGMYYVEINKGGIKSVVKFVKM